MVNFDLRDNIYYNCTVNPKEVSMLLDRLQLLEDRYEKLNELLSDPEIVNNIDKLRDYSKEQSDLETVVTMYREYKEVISELEDAKVMLEDDLDAEMADMVKMEMSELSEAKEDFEEKLRVLLLQKDRNDDKKVIVEIRAAEGGDERYLLSGGLFSV